MKTMRMIMINEDNERMVKVNRTITMVMMVILLIVVVFCSLTSKSDS